MGFFSSHKPHITTIIDIGSSSVGVASFLMQKDVKPKIIHTVRKEMVFQNDFQFERFVASMLETLELTTQEVSHLKIPEHSDRSFLCVFASPWYASQTRILKKKFEKPIIIERKFLEDVQENEIKIFKEREMKVMGADAVLLEAESIQTKLNGYDTVSPFGKETSDFQTAMYISISPHIIVSAVTDKIKKAFHTKTLHFSSFPFASFITMRDIFPENNFLLIDISGEVTDISTVRDNVLEETVSFPLGKNFLLRKIATENNSTYSEAISSLHMVNSTELSDESTIAVNNALQKAGEEWLKEFQKILSPVMERKEMLPRNVFITADDDVSKWFLNNIEKIGKNSFSSDGGVFFVRHLNTSFLSSFCETESGVTRDSFLMLEGLFAKRFI